MVLAAFSHLRNLRNLWMPSLPLIVKPTPFLIASAYYDCYN